VCVWSKTLLLFRCDYSHICVCSWRSIDWHEHLVEVCVCVCVTFVCVGMITWKLLVPSWLLKYLLVGKISDEIAFQLSGFIYNLNERELSFAEWQRSRVCVCRARLWSSWSYGRTWTILPAWHRRTHRLTVPHYSWPDFRAGHVVVAVVCLLSVPSSRHISKTKQDRPVVTMDLSKLASLILRRTQILPRRCPREINTTYVSCC